MHFKFNRGTNSVPAGARSTSFPFFRNNSITFWQLGTLAGYFFPDDPPWTEFEKPFPSNGQIDLQIQAEAVRIYDVIVGT